MLLKDKKSYTAQQHFDRIHEGGTHYGWRLGGGMQENDRIEDTKKIKRKKEREDVIKNNPNLGLLAPMTKDPI